MKDTITKIYLFTFLSPRLSLGLSLFLSPSLRYQSVLWWLPLDYGAFAVRFRTIKVRTNKMPLNPSTPTGVRPHAPALITTCSAQMNLILISITKFSLWHSFVSEFLCVFGREMQAWFSPFCLCLVLACTSAGDKAVDGELWSLMRTSGSYERLRLAVGGKCQVRRNKHTQQQNMYTFTTEMTNQLQCLQFTFPPLLHTRMQTDGGSGHWHSSLFPTLTNIIYHLQQPLCCVCVYIGVCWKSDLIQYHHNLIKKGTDHNREKCCAINPWR